MSCKETAGTGEDPVAPDPRFSQTYCPRLFGERILSDKGQGSTFTQRYI